MDGAFDLILSDYSLPGSDGAAAQSIARERRPEVPFVFVSGTIGEHAAIEGMKAGATDYVLKHNLERLPAAVRRAVREAGDRRERRNAELEVQRLNAELEQRVIRRTEQLARANRQLEIREEQLRDAKAFLEHLVSASPSIIFRLDPRDLRMTYVSPNVGWLLGYSIEEVTGTPDFWEQLVHPDDRPRVIGRLRAALDETVAQIEQEYRFRSKDGRYRWFFNLLRIEYDAETTPIAVLGYALDIADRKAAEAEVERAHNFLDSVVENLPVMVFVKDAADLRFIRLNRAGEQLLAINRSELIGRTSGEVFPPQLAEASRGPIGRYSQAGMWWIFRRRSSRHRVAALASCTHARFRFTRVASHATSSALRKTSRSGRRRKSRPGSRSWKPSGQVARRANSFRE
jgi:PAS domain S-box-containing protein